MYIHVVQQVFHEVDLQFYCGFTSKTDSRRILFRLVSSDTTTLQMKKVFRVHSMYVIVHRHTYVRM